MRNRLLLAVMLLSAILAGCGGAAPAAPPTVTSAPTAVVVETSPPEPTAEAEPTAPPEPTEPPAVPEPEANLAEAEASSDNVTLRRLDGGQEALRAPNQTLIAVGEGVAVDNGGRAIVRFRDAFAVEVVRDGDIDVEVLDTSEQSVFVRLRQRAGTTVNNFNPGEVVERRFEVQTDFATVTATGTAFLLVREADSPLEWIVGLDAAPDDLDVEADGLAKGVVAGQARWIAPVGVPSAGVEANMGAVEEWVANARVGMAQPEIGEVIWPQADAVTDMAVLDALPAAGEPALLGDSGITFSLDPEGLFGRPGYSLEDCNGDGIQDIAIDNGTLTLDFRTVLARVRAVDATVLNRGEAGSGALVGRDPATDAFDRVPLDAAAGQCQVLSLRAEAPYHYADLQVSNACLLGVSLTPPASDGQPGPPRAAVAGCDQTPPPGQDPEPTEAVEPTAVPTTPPPADSASITDVTVQDGRYYVYFETYGFEPQLPGQHVHFFWNTVPPEQAGVPGSGPWQLYPAAPGQPNTSPFTMFAVDQRPYDATRVCVLVANGDHSVRQGSGNCYDLP